METIINGEPCASNGVDEELLYREKDPIGKNLSNGPKQFLIL